MGTFSLLNSEDLTLILSQVTVLTEGDPRNQGSKIYYHNGHIEYFLMILQLCTVQTKGTKIKTLLATVGAFMETLPAACPKPVPNILSQCLCFKRFIYGCYIDAIIFTFAFRQIRCNFPFKLLGVSIVRGLPSEGILQHRKEEPFCSPSVVFAAS